jgi:hypothetical protein
MKRLFDFIPTLIGYILLIPGFVMITKFLIILFTRVLTDYEFWVGQFKKSGLGFDDNSTGIAGIASPIPIFSGLMAIAGAILIKKNK